jgi:Fuc2NAc and GlcNAc transferase
LTNWLTLCVLPLLISLILSRLVIHYFGNRLLDTPNIRSSHQIPTPRGGGIAMAGGVIITVLTALSIEHINPAPIYWLMIPSGLIAILGICDDFFNLNIAVRLTVQFLIAALGIYLIWAHNELPAPIQLLIAGIMILFIVWMTNLYNFMDGINGLAALEAIIVCMSMTLIYWIENTNTEVIYLLIMISASAFGFLFWNFPKAKLFMGDAGSLFLGLSFGLLAIGSLTEDFRIFSAWLIMLGVFIVDTSYTLFYRLITRQAVHQAHRTHAYQKTAIKLNSHTYTTLAIVAINLFWLLPIAIAVTMTQLHFAAALLIAYAPLLLVAHKFRAGSIEQSTHK